MNTILVTVMEKWQKDLLKTKDHEIYDIKIKIKFKSNKYGNNDTRNQIDNTIIVKILLNFFYSL